MKHSVSFKVGLQLANLILQTLMLLTLSWGLRVLVTQNIRLNWTLF